MAKNSSQQIKFNPNAAKFAVFNSDVSQAECYPRFIQSLRFDNFRHIAKLNVGFSSPVTVISGSNRCGKTTILLSIACSHFDFLKRNYSNGKIERQTWSHVLKFTNHDLQSGDWNYYLTIKTGEKSEERRGQRKAATRKWNGLGKKESQIKNVPVIYLDLDRILPARYASSVLHKKAQTGKASAVSPKNQALIEQCLSYVFEENYHLSKIAGHLGTDVLGFDRNSKYSSYNSASGEDVVSRILIDCIDAPKNSLVLIDEIELGLHPKVQRRLMDVIFEISTRDAKQFIVTSHSAAVISSVPESSRVFIDLKNGTHTSISPISINTCLSKMDSKSYPLLDVFCEDDTAKKILEKAIQTLNSRKIDGIYGGLINIIDSGPADQTYGNFQARQRTYSQVQIRSGHCCILDGDMRIKKNKTSHLYPQQAGLFFLPGTEPPEKVLCDLYEKVNQNNELRYHVDNSNVHSLFDKVADAAGLSNRAEAFELCWNVAILNPTFSAEFEAVVDFLIDQCKHYSPDL